MKFESASKGLKKRQAEPCVGQREQLPLISYHPSFIRLYVERTDPTEKCVFAPWWDRSRGDQTTPRRPGSIGNKSSPIPPWCTRYARFLAIPRATAASENSWSELATPTEAPKPSAPKQMSFRKARVGLVHLGKPLECADVDVEKMMRVPLTTSTRLNTIRHTQSQ